MDKLAMYDKEAFIKTLKRQGIRNQAVLDAMATVPREEFVGIHLQEFAYDNSPLPIEEGQTISQPYIVAFMTEALELNMDSRVLEVGTGYGYAAAILAHLSKEVFTIERHQSLAHLATSRLQKLNYNNVHVLCGDGTLGWPEHAPYDGIIVAAGGPRAPRSLIEQLAIGGRLVIPMGPSTKEQKLTRITRINKEEIKIEELGAVRFVPLIGEEGWLETEEHIRATATKAPVAKADPVSELIVQVATHIPSIESVNLGGLMNRIGDARIVLLGEATHGTAEFYDMRARITKELIEQKGFQFVAAEADWPDASQIDHFVRDSKVEPTNEVTFARFPIWMWANAQVLEFVKWLRQYNKAFISPDERVGFYGLDLYSLYSSIDSVINYLDDVDHESAAIARRRYACLTPWQADPATYGALALTGKHKSCVHAQ